MRAHPGLLMLLTVGFVELGKTEAKSSRPPAGIQRGGAQRVRDPFRAPDAGSAMPRPPGLAGVGVTEAVIRGIVRCPIPPGVDARPDPSGWAILESLSGEGFVAASGDHLLDGVLGRVEAGGVVFWLGGDPDRPVYRPLARPAGPEEGQ